MPMGLRERRLRSALPGGSKKTTPETDARAGGKMVEAFLGPKSLNEMGTDANSHLPRAINKAREKYPKCHFKSGHILNADFGGDGNDYANMTILTASANSSMQGFDNHVRNALRLLKDFHKSYQMVDINKYMTRIKLVIKVSSAKWSTDVYPDNCIAKYVRCRAKLCHNKFEGADLAPYKDRIDWDIEKINEEIGKANNHSMVDNRKT